MEKIRRLDIDYIEEIHSFDRLCFPEEYTLREYWLKLLEDKRTYYYAIIEEGEIRASASVYKWKGLRDYNKLMTISTHPDHRERGYGHRLIQHMIDEAKKDGIHKIKAETRESNKKMQSIFRDFGFILVNRVEEYYENPIEAAYKYILEL